MLHLLSKQASKHPPNKATLIDYHMLPQTIFESCFLFIALCSLIAPIAITLAYDKSPIYKAPVHSLFFSSCYFFLGGGRVSSEKKGGGVEGEEKEKIPD